METISENKCFGGEQAVFEHQSDALSCPMRFGVYTPPGDGPFPVLFWLSGLTCTEQNFITKAGAQGKAADLGMVIVAPDTSPRGDDVADQDTYDFGKGAGFYLDATEDPWAKHYKMGTYIAEELPDFIFSNFPVDKMRAGIFGHSMGGHGALVHHFRQPDLFRTCSAFSPIVAPSQVPWGQKALGGYLGGDEKAWEEWDATALIKSGRTSDAHILIDQGEEDEFLEEHLKPEIFEAAARETGQSLSLRRQPGYDHSYYFISTFIDDHLEWHARALD